MESRYKVCLYRNIRTPWFKRAASVLCRLGLIPNFWSPTRPSPSIQRVVADTEDVHVQDECASAERLFLRRIRAVYQRPGVCQDGHPRGSLDNLERSRAGRTDPQGISSWIQGIQAGNQYLQLLQGLLRYASNLVGGERPPMLRGLRPVLCGIGDLAQGWVEEGRHFAPAIAYRLESTKRRIFIGQDDDGECHLRRLAIPYIIIILHFCGLAEIIGFNRLGQGFLIVALFRTDLGNVLRLIGVRFD